MVFRQIYFYFITYYVIFCEIRQISIEQKKIVEFCFFLFYFLLYKNMNNKTSTKKHLCKWCNVSDPTCFYSREKSVCKLCRTDINKINRLHYRGNLDISSKSWIRMSSFGFTLNDNHLKNSNINNDTDINSSTNFIIDDNFIEKILENPIIFQKLQDSFKPLFNNINYDVSVVCDQVQYLNIKVHKLSQELDDAHHQIHLLKSKL